MKIFSSHQILNRYILSKNIKIQMKLFSNMIVNADSTNSNPIKINSIKRPLNIPTAKLPKMTNINDDSNRSSKMKLHLCNLINSSGPIGLDEYMKNCLYNKNFGYYTTKDYIFGEKGDFITSPEISQMFGETIAIFIYKILEDSFFFPKTWDLLEVGAGRGFLMMDIIKSMIDFKRIEGMNVIIIETSDKLAKIQQENINSILLKNKIFTEYEFDKDNKIEIFKDIKKNFTMKWFKSLDNYISYRNGIILEDASKNPMRNWKKFTEVTENPKLNPLIIINNEFFDALPIKKFIYKDKAWREILVDTVKPDDVNKSETSKLITSNSNYNDIENNRSKILFKYTISDPNSDSVSKYLQPDTTFSEMESDLKENDTYEFSVDQIRYMFSMCFLLATTKFSAALICDYGEDHAFSNSFRGIKSQKILKDDDILKYTGESDLTSYVNFKALRKVVSTYSKNLKFGGLMKQGVFLEILQMHQRLITLQSSTNKMKEKEILLRQFNKLVSENEMGDNYKFMYVHKNNHKPCYPFIDDVFKLIDGT